MRLFLRCFRCRKLVPLVLIFILIMLSVRMRGFMRLQHGVHLSPHAHRKYFYVHPNTNFTVGSFLKNKAVGNESHCSFRYGEWANFSYADEDLAWAPELGDKGPYRVLYSVVEGALYNVTDPYTVTYVSHVTLEYVTHVAELVTRWDGLLSVAAFLPGTDAVNALKMFERLCWCMKEMENVSVHFVFPVDHQPNVNGSRLNVSSSTTSLPVTESDNTESCFTSVTAPSYRAANSLVYPVNVARNVARFGSKTEFLLVSDVELFPSEHLVPEFLEMMKRLKERSRTMGDHYFTKKRHVFVVPVFEVADDVPDVPRNKSQLLDLYARERAVYFHRHVCLHCQRFPGLQRWLQRKVNPRAKQAAIQPLLVVRREFPYHRWEPIYIGTNQEPLYSEALTWEGQQDKMTQMHEMCLLDYRFVILNGAFLVHTPGMKRRQDRVTMSSILGQEHKKNTHNQTGPNLATLFSKTLTTAPGNAVHWRSQHIQRNEFIYQLITQDVVGKYKNNPRCRVH